MEISRDVRETGAPPPVVAPDKTPPKAADADPYAHLRAAIGEAWADTTHVWAELLGQDAIDAYTPQIAFVPKLQATHCYGLYVSPGPVYCSANNTVFVSLEEMQRLEIRLPGFGEGGLALLVAHEFGHHIQKLTGRFRLLSNMIRTKPGEERDLVRRFELEADCLAGLWAGHSRSALAAPAQRQSLLQAAESIGDDRTATGAATDPANFTHGTAAQRKHWLEAGMRADAPDVCDVLGAAEY